MGSVKGRWALSCAMLPFLLGCLFADDLRGNVANFDDLPEGQVGATLVDGGITFSNAQSIVLGPTVFAVDDARGSFSNFPGFTSPNIIDVGGFSRGPLSGVGRVHSLQFSTGSIESSASIMVICGNDRGDSVTLEGLLNGNVVATDTYAIPGGFFNSRILAVAGNTFDQFMLVTSGPNFHGDSFVSFDSVVVNVPEPPTAAIAILSLAALISTTSIRKRLI